MTCPDCGCSIEAHNAVNRLANGPHAGSYIAHCGGCGACWRTRCDAWGYPHGSHEQREAWRFVKACYERLNAHAATSAAGL